MSTRLLTAAFVLAGLAVAPAASGQTGDTRPYQAVFGAASREPHLKQSLGFSLQVQQAWTDDGYPEQFAGNLAQGTGSFGGVTGGARFDWRGKRVQVAATAGSGIRHYRADSSLVADSTSASFGLSARLGRVTNLNVNHALSYAPAFSYGVMATSESTRADQPGSNVLANDVRSLVNTTSVSLTNAVGRRGLLSFVSDVRIADTHALIVGGQDLSSYSVGGSYKHGLSRDVSLVLGYAHTKTDYPGGSSPVEHQINAGLDYHKALSLSRKTTFTTSFGSAVLSGPVSVANTTPTAGSVDAQFKKQFQVRANAQLAHQIGRTWVARAFYDREVGYVEELRAPVLTSTASATVSGFVSRRMDLSATASYSLGNDALTNSSGFSAYSGNAQLRMAVSKSWAVFLDYQYYTHDFALTADVTVGVPRSLSQNTLRTGLTLWVPVRRR